MIYIKLHSGKFNDHTHEVIEELHGLTGLNELSVIFLPRDIHSLHELSANGLNEFSLNCLNVLSITISPCDIRCLNELSLNGLNELYINIRPRNIHDLNELYTVCQRSPS